jgi:DNA topoisomerase 2-associated protein PAT1
MRELAKAAGGKATTTFVQLEGLGKVPFGNVRRPKPLLELALASELKSSSGAVGVDDDAEAAADLADAASATPLEAHPRVALRLMLEDGLCLLADVDDCDRLLFKAGSGASSGGDAAMLMRRKTLLLEGLTATLRLPSGPELAKTESGGAGCGDAVLRAVGSLSKGRRMLAGLLTRLPPGGASVARVAWSLARSLRHIFASPRQPVSLPGGEITLYGGDSSDDRSFAALADAASGVFGTFTPLQLCAVLAAVLAGGALPALDASQPGAAAADFLAAVLRSATAKGLAGPAEESSSSAASTPPEASVWQATFAPFFATLSARVAAAMAAAATAAASGDSTREAVARRDVPVDFTVTQPQTLNNWQFEDVAYAQLTGVGFYKPLETLLFQY